MFLASVSVQNHKRIKFGRNWKMAFSIYVSLELGGKMLLVILVLILQGPEHHHTQIDVTQSFLRHI